MRCRTALRLASLGAIASSVGLDAVVAACAPPPIGRSPAPAATGQASGGPILPTYAAFRGPPPDQPGSDQGVQPVYVHYPKNPVKSVSIPPGKGSQITALTNTVNAPPAPMDQNPAWQAVNQQLEVRPTRPRRTASKSCWAS